MKARFKKLSKSYRESDSKETSACVASGPQLEAIQEVVGDTMKDMMKDIRNTLKSVHKHMQGGSMEGQGVILPINFLGHPDGESRLSRSLPFEPETRLSQLKDIVKEAVEPLIKGQNRLMDMCKIIRTQGDESRAVLDFVKDVTKALRAEKYDTPRLACLLSPWDFENPRGLTLAEQNSKVWTKKLQEDSARRKGWFTKDMRLFLLCARTYHLVPCGPDGHGYHITEVRNWVKRAFGVMRVMVELTSVTLGVGAAVGLASNVLEAVGGTSEIAKNEDVLSLKERYAALGNDESYRRCDERQVAYPEDVVVPLEGKAYEFLKDFIHQEEDEAFAEMVKAVRKARRSGHDPPDTSRFVFFEAVMKKHQEDVGSGDVKWVLKNAVESEMKNDQEYEGSGESKGGRG